MIIVISIIMGIVFLALLLGCTASFLGSDISDKIWYEGAVDTEKLGRYNITCKVRKNRFTVEKTRKVKVVDTFNKSHGTKITTYCARCIENEILMYFRSNNKTNKNISINESIGFDKEGNEITILDILNIPTPNYIEEISEKDNVKLLKKYFNSLNPREKEIISKKIWIK